MPHLKDAHIFEKQPEGHYVEPFNLDRALIKWLLDARLLKKTDVVLDPSCGWGHIVLAAREKGLIAYGSDIVPRWEKLNPAGQCYFYNVEDFLTAEPFGADAIIMNPPYDHTREFITKAIREANLVVAIVPATWICANGAQSNYRADWLEQTPLLYYIPIVPRPSMPTGEHIQSGGYVGGGTKNFAIMVWLSGYEGHPVLKWLKWKK